ncbi:Regulator of G-protein signaling DHEX domain [Popillia japonica]|uniref:Regulator of G-protein signaling DHEX domain n=1 Tax=Popillia japonica TaxID=7064 RepID=A0AAW1LBD0_POPJA
MEIDRERCHRPSAFDKMEGLVREMQEPETGVPVRSQKIFLTSIPFAFMGYDLIEWLMERLSIEESEALNLANQLCQYGYFFPVNDTKNLVVKDDSSLYRFQTTYYWPWQKRPPDNVEYAIYLAKRNIRNKQRHSLEEYEIENLNNLRKNLANKWEFISIQAEEQAKLVKVLKKGDKIVQDSQERAYWRVHRPPPGMVSSLEHCPVPTRCRNGNRTRKRTIEDCRREVDILKNSLSRTRIKVSQALDSMVQHVDTYSEYDPIITGTQPSNPWVTEDLTFWQLNSPIVETPTEKRVRRWALSMEELVSDPTGLREFTIYLKKEYSHENIRFWMAVNDLRRSSQSQIQRKVYEIFDEFLAPGAPCEINIDGKTMEKVHHEMKNPSRFTFDAAQEHVYTLLLKKDCYPRFIRSEHYKNLQAAGVQPSQKKKFFTFGQTKKKSTQAAPTASGLQQHMPQGGVVTCGALSKRRGSDRSLSGSAHELAISGVRETRVAHSHSQSNLSDIPYRADISETQNPEGETETSGGRRKLYMDAVAGTSASEEVCPWELGPEPRSRKNSIQMDSGSSSSDISVAVGDVSDRFRRHCGLVQQYTLDGDKIRPGHSGRKLSTASCIVEARRASVSAPLALLRDGEKKAPAVQAEDVAKGDNLTSSSVTLVPCASDTNKIDESEARKTLKKNHSLVKTCSITGPSAPTISVSSVVDDQEVQEVLVRGNIVVDEEDVENEEEAVTIGVPTTYVVVEEVEVTQLDVEDKDINNDDDPTGDNTIIETLHSDPCCSKQLFTKPQQLQLAPLAVPDCESPVSECASEDVLGQEEQLVEAKSNDVCPWEDEDSCKVDTPFVKTFQLLVRGNIVVDEEDVENEEEAVTIGVPTTYVVVEEVEVTQLDVEDKDINNDDDPTGDNTIIETLHSDPCCSKQLFTKPQQLQLAPLAVPDCESPVSECASEDVLGQEEQLVEAKSNDVCPWEDEDSCKVDTPFVKTYATLGYL